MSLLAFWTTWTPLATTTSSHPLLGTSVLILRVCFHGIELSLRCRCQIGSVRLVIEVRLFGRDGSENGKTLCPGHNLTASSTQRILQPRLRRRGYLEQRFDCFLEMGPIGGVIGLEINFTPVFKQPMGEDKKLGR